LSTRKRFFKEHAANTMEIAADDTVKRIHGNFGEWPQVFDK
jgi:hypothetical protein